MSRTFTAALRRRLVQGLFSAWAAATGCAALAQEEVPFITTPDRVTLAMLELAAVSARDYVIDLGSGDGRIVITAARRFGARGLGVEIVPDLVQQSRRHALQAGVAERAEFREQDLFETSLAGASVVTLYLLPAVNLQLRPRLLQLPPGTRVVSHDWDMGDWAPDRSLSLDVPDKAIGREKRSQVHLWVVPAQVQGLWCSGDLSLQIEQRFQHFSATLSQRGVAAPLQVWDGRIQAQRLQAQNQQASGSSGESGLELALTPQGTSLQVQRGAAAAVVQEGQVFARAPRVGGPQGLESGPCRAR